VRIASLNDGSRDGRLAVVSEDQETCRDATGRTLQAALDSGLIAPVGEARPFDIGRATAPLPRAYQFLDGSAYVNHVELVRKARGAEMPQRFWTDPLMYQGLSVFAGPREPIRGHPGWGMDFEAEIAVITRDVPQGTPADSAADFIAFVMLLNDVSLRNLIPDELSKGFGFVQSKPICACSPMAVSPDALGGWDGRKLSGIMRVDLNGAPFGRADAGQDMTFDFGDLIAHAAKTRALPAGTVIGSGTVSNKGENGDPGRPVAEGGRGYSCIAEQRMVETILHGGALTPFLAVGDRVTIWMEDSRGRSIFGAIDQRVELI
jgi:fumarylacetoacetate (FAA) hydrolase